jgi:hypothetical protein
LQRLANQRSDCIRGTPQAAADTDRYSHDLTTDH